MITTNVNPASVAIPPGVVTDTSPDVPAATTAVILVGETTVNDVAGVPPKLTAVAPVKFVPVIVTIAVVPALIGVKDDIVGVGMNVNPASVTVPPGVVTDTFPEVPAPTTAVILVGETTANDVAAVPPKLTAVAPVRFVPVIVTVVAVPALVGLKDETVGAGIIVNPVSVAIPPGVVTDTFPEVPAPTTAVILVGETTANDVAAVPPKLTAVAPVRFVPVIVTVVAVPALVGVNDDIVGGGVNVNPACVAIPPGVVTDTVPEVPAPTTAVILVGETTVKDVATVPPKLTAVAPEKLVPIIVIAEPLTPLVGVNDEIVGVGINVKPASVAIPPGVVTDTLPDVPVVTTAVIVVGETTVNNVAAVPPKPTAVAPEKLVPVIVTVEPLAPLAGVNDEIVGAGGINVNPTRVAIPPGVVTDTFPDVPAPTTVVMLVGETTVKDAAAVPPKLTAVAPEKLLPVIVTVEPFSPLVGVKEEIVGVGINVNPGRVAIPPGVVTDTFPDVPVATTAVIVVGETSVNDAAAVPPKLTAVAPEKLVPVSVTVVPLDALVGVNEEIVGVGINVNPGRVAIPPGVVTDRFPDVPVATTDVIVVGETTVKDVATVPPKLTAVAPEKLVPVIVTVEPLTPLVGVNEEIMGVGINVNPVRVAIPPGVVTDTLPDVPVATTAVIVVGETTVNDVAAVPPKLTAVAPEKLVPVSVTVVPLAPLVGVNEEIVGVGINVNPVRVAIPPGVVTDTFPDVPAATTAVMLIGETTVNDAAAVPPKLTAVAPEKLAPVIVTVEPLAPLVGVNDEIVGVGINVKPASVAIPPGVVTDTLPDVPVATTAVIVVGETTVNDVAAVPPKLTAVVSKRPVPVIVTVEPLSPLVGVMEEMPGTKSDNGLDETPPLPEKRFVPLTAKGPTKVLGKPVFTAAQLLPLLVDKKTPALVPAKIFVPLRANEDKPVFIRPVFTAVQLLPLFVDKKTLPLKVPAKIFVPLMAKERTFKSVRPVFTAVQLLPLLVDKKTPPPKVPAKRFVPLTAKEITNVAVKPVFTTAQLLPLLVDKKTPPPKVPVKRFVPLTAKEYTNVVVSPVFTAVQLLPLLVDKKTPPLVPAKRLLPLTAKERTYVFVKPVFTAVQLLPLLVDKKTPPPLVPAKIFVPLTVKEITAILVSPVFTAVQLLPVLVDKKTPAPSVPAKIFVPLTAKERTYVVVKPALTAVQLPPVLVDKKRP